MKLVLAEKPSVAQSLAKVLGANKRCDGYLEGNGYIVSWCVGHLVELSPPEAYDETYAKWRLSDLPILPATWKYQVSASTRKQFGILKKLMNRYDVESLVCATDAGKAKKSPDKTPAEIGFSYCNQLFELEKEYAQLDAGTRKAKRLETEPAIWKAYWSWLETVGSAGGSRLAKAVTYAKNQKPYMENYLLDGRCSISNNIAENIARPYAVGRKNFLFHDTVKGARASSVIYSLVETAKLNNLNIYAYLETVLLYMPDYKNEPEGIEELMPWSDMIQQRCRIKSKS